MKIEKIHKINTLFLLVILSIPLIYANPTIVESIDQIINNEIESGNFEILKYQDTGLIILDYKNRSHQTRALGRITIFVEDENYSNEIVPYSLVEEKEKFLMAHDLKSEDLANFFNIVKEKNTGLTKEEKELKELILEHNLIMEVEEKYQPIPKTALISLHQDPEYREYRETMASHELQHGLDFTSPIHWKESQKGWQRASKKQKEAFKKFLQNIGIYDTLDENLVITEFRAFTHTTGERSYEYYINSSLENGFIEKEEADLLLKTSIKQDFWDKKETNFSLFEIILATSLIILVTIFIIKARKK
jgi:hypothetical protein